MLYALSVFPLLRHSATMIPSDSSGNSTKTGDLARQGWYTYEPPMFVGHLQTTREKQHF